MRVFLTFDAEHPDRPHCPPSATQQILQVLRRSNVRATFFLQGRWVEAYPHIAREIALDGHRIGNHSFYHARLQLLSDEGLATDITGAEQVIKSVTGADPRPWFRCPWGECGNDPRVLQSLTDLGYRHIGWHVEADEWEIARTPQEIENAVVDGALAAGDGAIILLHTWPASVPPALPAIIRRLGDAGVQFATLDDLAEPSIGVVAARGPAGNDSSVMKGRGHS